MNSFVNDFFARQQQTANRDFPGNSDRSSIAAAQVHEFAGEIFSRASEFTSMNFVSDTQTFQFQHLQSAFAFALSDWKFTALLENDFGLANISSITIMSKQNFNCSICGDVRLKFHFIRDRSNGTKLIRERDWWP